MAGKGGLAPEPAAARLPAVTAVAGRVAGTHRGAAIAEHLLVGVVEELLFQLQHDLRVTGPWARGGAGTGCSRVGRVPLAPPPAMGPAPAPRVPPPALGPAPALRAPPLACSPSGRCPTRGRRASRPRWCRRLGPSASWPWCRASGDGGRDSVPSSRWRLPHPSAVPAEGPPAAHIRAHGPQADPRGPKAGASRASVLGKGPVRSGRPALGWAGLWPRGLRSLC